MQIPGANLPAQEIPPHHASATPVPGLAKADINQLIQGLHAADAATLLDIAQADIVKLNQILQPTYTAGQSTQVQTVLKETALAVAGGDTDKAISFLADAVKLNPAQLPLLLDELRTLPVLRLEAPADILQSADAVQGLPRETIPPEVFAIHADVERLAHQMTAVAKWEAEVKLGQAETAVEAAGGGKLPHWETRPETLLQVGHRLYHAGGYENYVKAADLATTIQTALWQNTVVEAQLAAQMRPRRDDEVDAIAKPTFGALARGWTAARKKLPEKTRLLWVRAPLLVLLLGWLAAGLGAGIFSFLLRKLWPIFSDSPWLDSWAASLSDLGFAAWGLGFLALAGFGFFATIRKR